MAGEATGAYGPVPVRVLLRGTPDGWHYVIENAAGGQDRVGLPAGGTRWQTGRRRDPEPPWWQRRLGEVAGELREAIGRELTDRCFTRYGQEAEIAWFAVSEPDSWEGLVTLREPDLARFPGTVPPYALTLEPWRGILLPSTSLLFETVAADAWAVLAETARTCGTPPPRPRFLCGYADHQAIKVGRGSLAVSTQVGPDGVERVCHIHAQRGPGWGGNPELRVRLDGIELLDDPAADVLWLLRELGHEVDRRGDRRVLAAIGLTLYGGRDGSFGALSLHPQGFFDQDR